MIQQTNGQNCKMRGGPIAKTEVCPFRRAAKRTLQSLGRQPKMQVAALDAGLKTRVQSWLRVNPKATAGDAVRAFPEFADAYAFFVFMR